MGGEIMLRSQFGKNVGVELQERDEDGQPLWCFTVDVVLTTPELVAFAQAILDEHAAVSPQTVAETLAAMRAGVKKRHYACAKCGGAIETLWPNRVITCPGCRVRYVYKEGDARLHGVQNGEFIGEFIEPSGSESP